MSDCYALLIDHDNVQFSSIGLSDVLLTWLSTSSPVNPGIPDVTVRVYGGWYSDEGITDLRFEAATFYHAHCPSLLSIGGRTFRIRFEFADSLVPVANYGEQQVAIRRTVVRRSKPLSLKFAARVSICRETDCEVRRVRKWARRQRGCTRDACPHSYDDLFERTEQKQVDVHLATDLLELAWTSDSTRHVAVFSDDADMLPALAAAARRRTGVHISHIRQGRVNSYLDDYLRSQGVKLINVGA